MSTLYQTTCFYTISIAYPIQCGQNNLYVIKANGKECKVNGKEDPCYKIEFNNQYRVAKFVNKYVLYMK